MNINFDKNKNGGSTPTSQTQTPVPVSNVSKSTINNNNNNNNSNDSIDTIKKNFSIIKNSVDNIGSEIKAKVDNVGDDLLNVAENPIKSIETLIQNLIYVPSVIGQIIEDPQFIIQVKIISLTLAEALSDSIEIITPQIAEAISKMVENVGRSSFLAIMDAVGVIPGVGEVLDIILTAHNVIKVIFSFTNVGLEMTEVYYTLISNMIRIYKQNAKEVEAANGRIQDSLNQFTSNNKQSGGKKIYLNKVNEINVINKMNILNKNKLKKQKSKTKTKKYKNKKRN